MSSKHREVDDFSLYSGNVQDILTAHSQRLLSLLRAHESRKSATLVATVLSFVATAFIVALLATIVDPIMADADIAEGNNLNLWIAVASALGVATSSFIFVFGQLRQSWIMRLQIDITAEGLDKIVSLATTEHEQDKMMSSAQRMLVAVQIAEAKAVLQHARYVARPREVSLSVSVAEAASLRPVRSPRPGSSRRAPGPTA